MVNGIEITPPGFRRKEYVFLFSRLLPGYSPLDRLGAWLLNGVPTICEVFFLIAYKGQPIPCLA